MAKSADFLVATDSRGDGAGNLGVKQRCLCSKLCIGAVLFDHPIAIAATCCTESGQSTRSV